MKVDTCSICCEGFTKGTLRGEVSCGYCEHSACASCYRRYLTLDTTTRDPHCMNCGVQWDMEFLIANLTKSFCFGKLKKHRENILFDRERALLPETQPFAERHVAKQKLLERGRKILSDIARLKKEYHTVSDNLSNLRNCNLSDRKKFTKGCPQTNCNGFLSTAYKCLLCETSLCPHCFVIKDNSGHICIPDDVASADAIKRDTKPCPACGTPISKVSGCDVMFSVCCKVFFSWNTGKKIRGQMHNPEYFRWLREHGGELPDAEEADPCGDRRFPHVYQTMRVENAHQELREFGLCNLLRIVRHVDAVTLRDLRAGDQLTRNRDLRIKYLLCEITEPKMKVLIQRREKAQEKNRQIIQVLEMFMNVVGELLLEIVDNPGTRSPECMMATIMDVTSFANAGFARIQKRYDCVGYQLIPSTWGLNTRWRPEKC